ncbi:MAG: alpha-amylase family protein [Paraprevotella sp.]|nr:alpha-amylase family protein [Paraprevotella sp.]
MQNRMIIYQVFTRLFGNDHTSCIPHGSKEENGCGRFIDFTSRTLQEIKSLGITHIWYTGIIQHATQTDYGTYGISSDHPAIVKGKAGSPFAIKDYFSVDPDLSTDPDNSMAEFQDLVSRTHKAGLKVLIDFVPNHVARQYHSTEKPKGIKDLGEDDRTDHAFNPQNNFYYIPGCTFQPSFDLKGDAATPYVEYPAKATGNDQFSPSPGRNDWYETVKLNYGIDYCGGRVCHFDPVPSTWLKMRDILLFWADKGIDGFRCDMAEMVPVEFWEWAIPQIKRHHPTLTFIAEVYNPNEYRNYLHRGGFDYLYDKVGLYDTLRAITCGHESARRITGCWQGVDDIKDHMLNFLENHDEQRLASDFFAGQAEKGRPALLVSACMGINPMMVYFGQELGEKGMDEEGFSGRDGRTTIFDYWSVDTIRRWRNHDKFDKTQLTADEMTLQEFYTRVLTLCNSEKALREGLCYDLMYANTGSDLFNADKCYTFVRKKDRELLIIVANFEDAEKHTAINLPHHLFEFFQIQEQGEVVAHDLLSDCEECITFNSSHCILTDVPAYSGKILKIKV